MIVDKFEHTSNPSYSLADKYFEHDPKWMREIARVIEARFFQSNKNAGKARAGKVPFNLQINPRLSHVAEKFLKKDSTVICDIKELTQNEETELDVLWRDSAGDDPEISLGGFVCGYDDKYFSKVLAKKVLRSAGLRSFELCNTYTKEHLGTIPSYAVVLDQLAKISGTKAANSLLAQHLLSGLTGNKTPEWLVVDGSDGTKGGAELSQRKRFRVLSLDVSSTDREISQMKMLVLAEDGRREQSPQYMVAKTKVTNVNNMYSGGKSKNPQLVLGARSRLYGLVKNVVTISGVCGFEKDKFVCKVIR